MTKKENRTAVKADLKKDQKNSDRKSVVATERERLICIQRIASVLAGVHSFNEIAKAVHDEILANIGATGVDLVLAEEGCPYLIVPTGRPEVSARASQHDSIVASFDLEALSPRVLRPLRDAIRSGVPLIISSTEEYLRRYPAVGSVVGADADSVTELDEVSLMSRSSVALPLLIEDKVVGGLLFAFDHWRTFTEPELFFHQTMAHLCALAISRIRLAEKESVARRREAAEREELQRALHARQQALNQIQEFQRLFGLALDLICILGFDGHFKLINPAWSNTLGYTEEELRSRPYLDFVHPDDVEITRQIAVVLWSEPGGTAVFKNRYVCADGSFRWLSWSVIVVSSEPGSESECHGSPGLYAVAHDITASQQAEDALRESTQFIQKVADASPNILYLYDMVEGRNIFGNHALGMVLGFSDAELQEMGVSMFGRLVHPDDYAQTMQMVDQLKNFPDERIIELEYRLRHRDGGYRWLSDRRMVFSRLPDGTTRQYVGAMQDITVRKDNEQRLRDANEYLCIVNQTMGHQLALIQEQTALLELRKAELEEANTRLEALATTDGLTGLTNHRTFQDKLSEEFERVRRYGGDLSLLMVDVDYFKTFNDRFGHPAGDVALKQIATVLVSKTRACDILARYGGEEFAIVLPETDAIGARWVAERIRSAIESGLWIGQRMTVSIGIVSMSADTVSAQHLVEEADRALYACKHRGRNMVVHYADLESGHWRDGLDE